MGEGGGGNAAAVVDSTSISTGIIFSGIIVTIIACAIIIAHPFRTGEIDREQCQKNCGSYSIEKRAILM